MPKALRSSLKEYCQTYGAKLNLRDIYGLGGGGGANCLIGEGQERQEGQASREEGQIRDHRGKLLDWKDKKIQIPGLGGQTA